MTVDTMHSMLPTTVARVGTELPEHEDASERITLGILTLFNKLRSLETLEPDPINGILDDPRIKALMPELWQIWGDAEYLLELDFARKVMSGSPSTSKSRQLWETFQYLDQYRQLARMETNTLDTALGERSLPPVRKIAFLGAGPTPFSALCFREKLGPDVEIINIDRCSEAISHGRGVAKALGEKNMSFVQAEVTAGTVIPTSSDDEECLSVPSSKGIGKLDLSNYDLVHFAALIGETETDKRDLLVTVAKSMRPGALIMLRSTDSLRQILYPKMDVDCWEVLSVVTPVLATRYFGGSTSLTTIVVSVDGVAGGCI